jgi:hypothetical protein
MRKLLKFKWSAEGCLVRYEQERDKGLPDTYTLESGDGPNTALKDALKAMAEHLLAICEMPATMAEAVTIIGVTITHTEENGRGVVITGTRKLKKIDAPMVLNSPHTTEYGYQCADALNELEKQVFAYVDGARQQLVLPFPAREVAQTRN